MCLQIPINQLLKEKWKWYQLEVSIFQQYNLSTFLQQADRKLGEVHLVKPKRNGGVVVWLYRLPRRSVQKIVNFKYFN